MQLGRLIKLNKLPYTIGESKAVIALIFSVSPKDLGVKGLILLRGCRTFENCVLQRGPWMTEGMSLWGCGYWTYYGAPVFGYCDTKWFYSNCISFFSNKKKTFLKVLEIELRFVGMVGKSSIPTLSFSWSYTQLDSALGIPRQKYHELEFLLEDIDWDCVPRKTKQQKLLEGRRRRKDNKDREGKGRTWNIDKRRGNSFKSRVFIFYCNHPIWNYFIRSLMCQGRRIRATWIRSPKFISGTLPQVLSVRESMYLVTWLGRNHRRPHKE